ncbi:hypothetical protein [Pseudomonas sp. 2FE]|uniref:hypothetical protein n=1 Tax=Pseudomonas sp. 2FE TaxID=2502190 RepID=UPI0010F83374|nr:hypothetical protein [Pseudomonas sp. 2FE]
MTKRKTKSVRLTFAVDQYHASYLVNCPDEARGLELITLSLHNCFLQLASGNGSVSLMPMRSGDGNQIMYADSNGAGVNWLADVLVEVSVDHSYQRGCAA